MLSFTFVVPYFKCLLAPSPCRLIHMYKMENDEEDFLSIFRFSIFLAHFWTQIKQCEYSSAICIIIISVSTWPLYISIHCTMHTHKGAARCAHPVFKYLSRSSIETTSEVELLLVYPLNLCMYGSRVWLTGLITQDCRIG